jgi:hypothetical protein
MIASALSARRFFVVDGPVVFQILWSSLTIHLGGVVVGVSYGTSKLRSRLGVTFNAIHGVHQPNMNL